MCGRLEDAAEAFKKGTDVTVTSRQAFGGRLGASSSTTPGPGGTTTPGPGGSYSCASSDISGGLEVGHDAVSQPVLIYRYGIRPYEHVLSIIVICV